MKLFIISVRDSAANAYMPPSFVPAPGVAVRAFRDEVNRAASDNMFYNHPEDVELFLLGQFDPETAKFELEELPRSLVRGKDCVVDKGSVNADKFGN